MYVSDPTSNCWHPAYGFLLIQDHTSMKTMSSCICVTSPPQIRYQFMSCHTSIINCCGWKAHGYTNEEDDRQQSLNQKNNTSKQEIKKLLKKITNHAPYRTVARVTLSDYLICISISFICHVFVYMSALAHKYVVSSLLLPPSDHRERTNEFHPHYK